MKNNKFDHFGGSFTITYPVCEPCDEAFATECCSECDNLSFVTEHIYITKVMYHGPATIIFWSDGTKTVSKCSENDIWNPEMGFIMAYMKKLVGSEEVRKSVEDWVTGISFENDVEITIKDVRNKHKRRS